MHPAEAILDAAFAAVEAALTSGARAYLHRASSLAEEEMPCICVNFGDDAPDQDGQTLTVLGSALEVILTAYAVGDRPGDTEKEVKALLLSLRAAGHRAMAGLAVSSVWHVEYGGASAPQIEQSGHTVGSLSSRWLVHYQMNIGDPE